MAYKHKDQMVVTFRLSSNFLLQNIRIVLFLFYLETTVKEPIESELSSKIKMFERLS